MSSFAMLRHAPPARFLYPEISMLSDDEDSSSDSSGCGEKTFHHPADRAGKRGEKKCHRLQREPRQRHTANAREREFEQQVNIALTACDQLIPRACGSQNIQKFGKKRTLRLASITFSLFPIWGSLVPGRKHVEMDSPVTRHPIYSTIHLPPAPSTGDSTRTTKPKMHLCISNQRKCGVKVKHIHKCCRWQLPITENAAPNQTPSNPPYLARSPRSSQALPPTLNDNHTMVPVNPR
ncbi:hypothetical protein GDO86_020305 [Hymenochirus boettgeri]|uniref:Uncharacterized protein n=1 Tax=Hymenochirus boettgeri TaxID=247094 RepID=A0A8T2IF07_9PIPI|nr:hypothetical protein GDO86_020305 [Hymenochirus boettgeri]